jgi:hypothetical protein
MDLFLLLGIVGILVVLWIVFHYNKYRSEGFQIQGVRNTGKPVLWWFTDDETNARSWWDFGARNSTKPNRGYLDVALDAVRATQGFDFDIRILLGRDAVAQVIKEAGETLPTNLQQFPAKLWRQWALCSLLAAKGGLVMAGDCTLCVGPSFAPLVRGKESAVFGTTVDEPRALPGLADVAPAYWVGWAAKRHSPVWDVAATTWNSVAIAGPTSWSAADARKIQEKIWTAQALKKPARFQAAEGSRKSDGTELTLEDLLMKQTPIDPKIILDANTIYVVMDGDALIRDYRYGWFVRMSKKQILESEFTWAVLAKKYQTRIFRIR